MSVQAPVYADMISTGEIAAASETESMRDEVRSLVARDDVRDRLMDYGVSEQDINQRIDGMTDTEIQELHGNLDALPVGQDALGVVVLVLVIFILLDVAGVTDIFPGV